MSYIAKLSLLLFLFLSPSIVKSYDLNNELEGGRNTCMVCTLVMTLVEGFGKENPVFLKSLIKDFCNLLPDYSGTCHYLVDNYFDFILDIILRQGNPDDICLNLGLCVLPQCRLYPKSSYSLTKEDIIKFEEVKSYLLHNLGKIVNSFKVPYFDEDGDRFSTIPYLRGSNWRGKDCNDSDSEIYPGRRTNSLNNDMYDHNCNGIYGVDERNVGYEDMYCSNSGQLGVGIIGGSACSHFVIRRKWFDWKNATKESYKDLFQGLLNEVDWPQLSWATGYEESSFEYGIVDSVYKRLRERNLCNHRDYQNLAENGASTFDSLRLAKYIKRDQKYDHPMLLFHSPLGNDICNTNVDDPIRGITKPNEFTQNVLETLTYLDSVLPNGSHIVFVGLVNGSALWEYMHNQMHPFGVTYEKLYSWLLCIRANPCTAWLTPVEEHRRRATEIAFELSHQYQLIISKYKDRFKNFDMAYYPFPLKDLIERRIRNGGRPQDLIDEMDGFHPSRIMNHMFGEWLFERLSKDHPTFIGKENPFNNLIKKKFGDQGGY